MAKEKEALMGPPWRLMCYPGSRTKYFYNTETKETLSVVDAKKRSRQEEKKKKEKNVSKAVVKKIDVRPTPQKRSPEDLPIQQKPSTFKIPKKAKLSNVLDQCTDQRTTEPMEIDIVELRKIDSDVYKTNTVTFSSRKNTDQLMCNSSICVFDTSALLHEPSMLRRCANANIAVMISFTVQVELDYLKTSSPHLLPKIQETLRGIEFMYENKPEMISFENSADRTQSIMIRSSSGNLYRFEDRTPDEKIIKTALRLKQNADRVHIFLVSDDLNQRTKAIAHQVEVKSSEKFMSELLKKRQTSPSLALVEVAADQPPLPVTNVRERKREDRPLSCHKFPKENRKSHEQRAYVEKRYNNQQVVLRFGGSRSPSPEENRSVTQSQTSSQHSTFSLVHDDDSMEM